MPQQQIKQQQQQRTTPVQFEHRLLSVTYMYMYQTQQTVENKSKYQLLFYHKTKACPLTAVFPLNVQLVKVAEPPLTYTAPPCLMPKNKECNCWEGKQLVRHVKQQQQPVQHLRSQHH